MSREHSDPASEYIVEKILPAKEVHFIGGPSGVGKTTWLFQFLRDWSEGRDVFGYPSHPVPFAYVSCDRSRDSILRTLTRVGVEEPDFPIVCLQEFPDWRAERRRLEVYKRIFVYVRQTYPDVRLLVIDGFTSLTPGGRINDYDVVAEFLNGVTAACKQNDMTVLGVVHATKVKKDQEYLYPRQRVVGSNAWAAYSETIFYIEAAQPDDTGASGRVLHVLPRNAAEQRYELVLTTDGLLLLAKEAPVEDALVIGQPKATDQLKEAFQQFGPDAVITKAHMVQLGKELGISERSVERILTELKQERLIEQIGRGIFRKVNLA